MLSRGGEAPGWRLPVIAALAAVVGTFSQAMGFATWPCLLVIALVCRSPLKIILLFAGGASISLLLYVAGAEDTGHVPMDKYAKQIFGTSWRILRSTAGLVGSSLGRVIETVGPDGWVKPSNVSHYAGFFGLVFLALYSLPILLLPARSRPRHMTGLGLMWFSTMVGVMVALSRPQFPETGMSIRFITASTLFWIGASFTITSLLQRFRNPWIQVAIVVFLCGISLAMLPSLTKTRALQAKERTSHAIRAMMHALDIRHDPFTQWRPMGKLSEEDVALVYWLVA